MSHQLFSLPMISRSVGFLILISIFAFCQSDTTSKKENSAKSLQSNKAQVENTQTERKLIVYYFHTNFRCPSCITIEKLTRQAVTEGFSEQLKSGRVEFKQINVEETGNEHFWDDYKLYTKSVILSDMKRGKEASWKNCEKVWTLLGKEQKFIDYIQSEIQALL